MASITITDVAAKAGVSIKTVSRVLNGEPNVSDATRDKVNAAMSALDYRPNLSARSLAGSRSYLIGVLADNSPEYVFNLQFGALKYCRPAGYHLLVDLISSNAADVQSEVAAVLRNVRADGFILSPPVCDNQIVLDAIEQTGIPYVRIAPYRDIERTPSVNIDDAGAAFDMTSLLISLGHRDIGFIRGPPDHGASHLRFGGYSSALRANRLPLRQGRIRQGDFTARSGMEAAEALLSGPDHLTAVFASNDEMALGVMLVANRLGRRVPEDISVCGFDDVSAARLVWPQLTTVRQPIAEMSAAAAEILINRSPEGGARLLDFEIVVRGSTGPAPRTAG